MARDGSRGFFVLARAQRNSYGMLDLAAWRLSERWFTWIFFSQRRKGRNEFLRNAGLGELGGLARDFNDSRARIYFLAKAQRTQRNFYGMPDLADLAAWREIVYADFLFSQRRGGRKGINSLI